MQLIEKLLNKLPLEEFEIFLVQTWLIWSQRNAITHGGTMQDPSRLGQRARDFLEEYRQAQHWWLHMQARVVIGPP